MRKEIFLKLFVCASFPSVTKEQLAHWSLTAGLENRRRRGEQTEPKVSWFWACRRRRRRRRVSGFPVHTRAVWLRRWCARLWNCPGFPLLSAQLTLSCQEPLLRCELSSPLEHFSDGRLSALFWFFSPLARASVYSVNGWPKLVKQLFNGAKCKRKIKIRKKKKKKKGWQITRGSSSPSDSSSSSSALLKRKREREEEKKHLKTPWEIKTWEGGRSSPSKSKDEAAYRAVAAAGAAASLIASWQSTETRSNNPRFLSLSLL